MRYLKPLPLKDIYWHGIEDEINRIFYQLIYSPIVKLLQKNHTPLEIVKNSLDDLADALKSGRIFYQDGAFYGDFNAKISKKLKQLGGKFNRLTKAWNIPIGNIPPEVSFAIAQSAANYKNLTSQMIDALNDIDVDQFVDKQNLTSPYEQSIEKMNLDFEQAVKNVSIPPKLTPEVRELIAREWGNNLKLYIRGWASENITSLREKVAANAMRGQRSANLVKMIQDNYGSSLSKARFLARQETSLLISKMRQQRYQDVGSRTYRWSTSKDERVRHDHKLLQGKIFSWQTPPIVDRKTGRKAHPGEDFNCRCVAMPILEN